MKLLSKRLFINNLPHGITQSDLNKKFSDYGDVTSVEIKDRKNLVPSQTPHFAYVQLDIEKQNLHKCLEEFASAEWKGCWLNVQEAKESFMERLKREREASSTNNSYVKANGVEPHVREEKRDVKKAKVNLTFKNVSKYKDDTSESEDDPVDSKKAQNDSVSFKGGSVDAKLVSNVDICDVKKSEANKKRLQSVKQMKKGYQQQKLLIKNALANTDRKLINKITFEDDDDDDGKQPPTKKSKCTIQSEKKMVLFDEDDKNDDEVNFEIREHLEGRKGQKLIELQSRFKGDRRFNMDARFLEDQSNSESENEEKEDSIEHEKKKQFEILEEVLGEKITKKPKRAPEKVALRGMLRFDPLQSEHSKYEIKEPPKPPVTKEKKKKAKPEVQEEPDKPEVSKDTFYRVQVDFKETLNENNRFSLANTFDVEVEEEKDEGNESQQQSKQIKQNHIEELDSFRYDSSSGDEANANEKEETTAEEQQKPTNDLERNKTARLWTDSLFFKEDDYRLEEGLSFIKRLELDEAGDFLSMRRDLKQAIKAKVKNNQRRNNPFKRKLGGKKRLKVKRALKR